MLPVGDILGGMGLTGYMEEMFTSQ